MEPITIYPNQKLIIKSVNPKAATGEIIRTFTSERAACRSLSHSGLKLWLFISAKPREMFGLSHEEANLPESSYKRAVNELIEKGYLKRIGDTNNYQFNEEID